MKQYFRYLIAVVLIAGSVLFSGRAEAEVCIQDQDAIDIISLLDSSERELELLGSCEALVKDLYKEIEVRDEKITKLTNQLIEAKQDTIKYRASAARWKQVAWYTSVAGVIVVVVQVLPGLL